MISNLFVKKLFLLGILFSIIFSVSSVLAANPTSPLALNNNILDPGSSSTPWGGVF
jgi:hypothetical protein